jgi:hypothetical protein
MPVQSAPESSDPFIKKDVRHQSVLGQPGNSRSLSHGSLPSENAESLAGMKQGHINAPPRDVNNSTRTASSFQLDKRGSQNIVGKISGTSSNAKHSEVQPHIKDPSLRSVSEEKDLMESKTRFPASGGRGQRYVYTVKNSSSKSSGPGPAPRVNRADSRGFMRRPNRNTQRTEFRVRESVEKRHTSSSVSTDQFELDNKSNFNGRGIGMSGRTGSRKSYTNKMGKQPVESVGENSHGMDSGSTAEKVEGKESTKAISHSGQSNLKRNLCSEEDVDAPLQSGIIRVFEQPGIEAPSDEDDFIEVRSKRQMINDRREQREKEIKAKSRVAKVYNLLRSYLIA